MRRKRCKSEKEEETKEKRRKKRFEVREKEV